MRETAWSDNLRGFFDQCLPTVLKRLFGYDGTSWLTLVARSPKEADARALLRLLSPAGPLFAAMYNADADGSTQFVFPKERLPTHTQMMLAAPAGRAELEARWPQYARAVVSDGAGRPHIHLGVFQYCLAWFAFYVLKGDGGGGMDAPLGGGGGGLGGSVRKAAGALHLTRGGRESEAMRHPYIAALRQFLLELVPRPAGAGGGGAGGAAAAKPPPGGSPYFRTPRRQANSATRGQVFYATLLEFWLTDGDEPVPLASTGALAHKAAAAAPPRAPMWSTTYEPPGEDLLEALLELIKHVSVVDQGGGRLQPAQGMVSWLPPVAMHTLAQPAGHRAPPAAPGPPRLGAAAAPPAQAFARRLFRFFHRAFAMWPEQRTIKPLLRCLLAYVAPWSTASAAPSLAPGALAAAAGHSQLTAQLTARVTDLAHRVHWSEGSGGGGGGGGEAGGYGPQWEAWVLSNLPFYTLLLPLFLDMSVARVEVRGESAAQDLVGVFGVLEAAPALRDLLAQADRELAKYAASQPRRADGAYAELLPWLLDQAHDWEVAATANAVGDTPAARAPPPLRLFATSEGSAAATARGLLDLVAHICKPEAHARLRGCLEAVLPLAALPAGAGAEAARGGGREALDDGLPRLPKSSWRDVRYRGDPLTRPITSFELGFFVRLLVALSVRLNAWAGLDRRWSPGEDQPETRAQELVAALRRRGWRVNLRPLADMRNLFWLLLALLAAYWMLRALVWTGAALAAVSDAAEAGRDRTAEWSFLIQTFPSGRPSAIHFWIVEELRKQHGFNEVKAKEVSIVIMIAAIIAVAVPNNGDRGWCSFTLLLIELNLIVWVGYYTDRNAGSAIKELEALAAPSAMCKRDGEWKPLPVRELVLGDLVALKGGDIIPADCQLVGPGEPLKVDESSLTGESLTVTRRPGDKATLQVLAGAVVAQGELDAVVASIGADTFFGKTMALLGGRKERGHLQKVLGRVSAGLGIVAAIGVLVMFCVMITSPDLGAEECLVIAFVVLVSTVPIGMPVVVAAVLAVGAREMVRENAIVSRLSALEELSGMEVLCSDKTGTLTLNKLSLDQDDVLAWGAFSQRDVLLLASLSARWSNQACGARAARARTHAHTRTRGAGPRRHVASDAIDRAITASVGGDPSAIAGYQIRRLVPFNPVDKYTLAEASVAGGRRCWGRQRKARGAKRGLVAVTTPDGGKLSTCKGAPQVIRDMLSAEDAKAACDKYIDERASRGLRSLGVAQSTDGSASWILVGLISLLDPPRPDSADTIKLASSLGVEVKMVTGDQHAIAVETCKRLGMGHNIVEGKELMGKADINEALIARVSEADGFAGVFPEHKFQIVAALQKHGTLVGMTGDGVNDAPALKCANVGIAVADATPAARGAADIILLDEGIGTIVTAMIRSRKASAGCGVAAAVAVARRPGVAIFRRLQTYIIYRLASSLTILGFFVLAFSIRGYFNFDFPTWALVLISLTNDLSVMATSYDKVHSSPRPQTWNMTQNLALSVSIAVFGVGSQLLLLILSNPKLVNWWHIFNISLEEVTDPNIKVNPQTVAVMYFGLTSFIQLSIFLTRNPSFWWHFSAKSAPRPSLALILPALLFVVGSFFIGTVWPASTQPDGGNAVLQGAGYGAIGITFAYCFLWLQFADVSKVLTQRLFDRQELIKEHCHRSGEQPPAWVRAIDAPGSWLDAMGDRLDEALADTIKASIACLPGRSAAAAAAVREKGKAPVAPDVEAPAHAEPAEGEALHVTSRLSTF
eukprot:scaffold20.g7731.t1